jgi:hypothetical protein
MVDLDNALNGNSLFEDEAQRPAPVEDPVFEGSSLDPARNLNIKA